MLNGVTIDGLPVEAIQAGDESGTTRTVYIYTSMTGLSEPKICIA